MSTISCQAFFVLDKIIWLYLAVLFVYAVLSWVPDLRGGWSRWVDMLVEPVIVPLRRVIPALGGFDLSFMVLFFGLVLINNMIVRPNEFACY